MSAVASHVPPLARDARGAVYLEFLLAFIPVFLLFLGTVQLALVYAARLVVRDAAIRAARAAIVVLEDDPQFYAGEPRGTLNARSVVARDPALVQASLRLFGISSPAAARASARGGRRLQAIRHAAYLPLCALAPSEHWLRAGFLDRQASVAGAFGADPRQRFANALFGYNASAAVVTLRRGPGNTELAHEPIAANAELTVSVSYVYHCAIPFVSRILCREPRDMAGLSDQARAELARELSHAEDADALERLARTRGRFRLLRAEATLPNQGASYAR